MIDLEAVNSILQATQSIRPRQHLQQVPLQQIPIRPPASSLRNWAKC
jgi:hypothetical protein